MKKAEVGVRLTEKNIKKMEAIFKMFPNERIEYPWYKSLETQKEYPNYLFKLAGYWCVGGINHKEVTPDELLEILLEEHNDNIRKEVKKMSHLVVGDWYELSFGGHGKPLLFKFSGNFGNETQTGFSTDRQFAPVGIGLFVEDIANVTRASNKVVIEALTSHCIKEKFKLSETSAFISKYI